MIFYSNIFSSTNKNSLTNCTYFFMSSDKVPKLHNLKELLTWICFEKNLRLRRISRRLYETLKNNQILQKKKYGKNEENSLPKIQSTPWQFKNTNPRIQPIFFFASESNAWIKIDKQRESRSLIHDSIGFRYIIILCKIFSSSNHTLK